MLLSLNGNDICDLDKFASLQGYILCKIQWRWEMSTGEEKKIKLQGKNGKEKEKIASKNWVTKKLPQIYTANHATFQYSYGKLQYRFAIPSGTPSIVWWGKIYLKGGGGGDKMHNIYPCIFISWSLLLDCVHC